MQGRFDSAVLAVALCSSCASAPQIPPPDQLFAAQDRPDPGTHTGGPGVIVSDAGPARFVAGLYDAFDVERALATTAFMDARHRTPGGPGFDQSLDRIAAELRRAGFGSQARLELHEVLAALADPVWIGTSARLAMRTPDGHEEVLHEFSSPADRDRCLLPRHAPSARIEGEACFSLDELRPGGVLVTETLVRPDLVLRARNGGAAAIVSASLGTYNVDPTGRERHLDAVHWRELEPGGDVPVAQISPRSFEALRAAHERHGSVVVSYQAESRTAGMQARTLVATIVGEEHADETVVLTAHVQEPGASDNASGAAGLLECALGLAERIGRGDLAAPSRSLTFLWGAELAGSEAWMASTERTPVAAIASVMAGESRGETGAIPLLERHPDPGAVRELPPDQHTLWGRYDVDPGWLVPNGLAVIARCAMVDVSLRAGAWETSENPYEGGTDHDVFIHAGIPAVLFWHFTDFTFHTSLDRMDMVDGDEIRRASVAAVATALSIADPVPADLDRYLRTNLLETALRVAAAREADDEELAEDWNRWGNGARHWLRALCLGMAPARGAGRGN